MDRTLDEARAALIISSEVLSGQQIADTLRMEPSKIIVKGDLTGDDNPARHPLNIVMFSSGVATDAGERMRRDGYLDGFGDLRLQPVATNLTDNECPCTFPLKEPKLRRSV